MPNATVFQMPQVIYATTGSVGAPNMNFPLNQTDIRIFKFVQNNVNVFVKNVDRKPVNMGSSSAMIVISNHNAKTTLLEKQLTVVDASRGLYKFTIESNELQQWRNGSYAYTLVEVDSSGRKSPLYTNQSYSCNGSLTIENGPYPSLLESTTVYGSDMVPRTDSNQVAYFITGALPGASSLGDPSGLNTLFAYLQEFSGAIRFDASLSIEPPTSDTEWFLVDLNVIAEKSSETIQKTFKGNYRWVRIVAYPTTGTILKFMLRN